MVKLAIYVSFGVNIALFILNVYNAIQSRSLAGAEYLACYVV